MTYASGQLIEATDYNGFASTNTNNVNTVWGTGSGDKGYGQSTTLSTVAVGATVTATQWADLNNRISSLGNQTNTVITARTNPVVGDVIGILSAINTDITNVTTNRGNAALIGSEFSTNGSSSAGVVGSNPAGWTLTYTQTMTFASADAARFFFNGGGIVRVSYSKSSTGTDKDPDWNQLAGWCGTINLTGRVNGTSQTIAGTSYSGTTRLNGTGGNQTTLTTTTGYYNLTPGGAATTIFQLNDTVSPYTGNYIRTTVALNGASTVLTFVTTWVDTGYSGAGTSNNISAGAATALSYFPPSTVYLSTASWGTPSLTSSVV